MRKGYVAASITAAVLGFGSIAGAGGIIWFRTQTTTSAATGAVHNDGILYDNVEPWADPAPPFPDRCAHPAYCQLGVDLVCTIVYVMLASGTADDDIVKALTPQHDEIHADDFTACPGFAHYWTPEQITA